MRQWSRFEYSFPHEGRYAMCLGIPGQLVEIIDLAEHKAVVDVDGVRREINIGLVMGEPGGIKVGEWVLVHVGFAMSRIDEDEAARTLAFIRELGSMYDDEIEQLSQETPL
ncbi:MAG TPA: HypC/HybG/HupF family hydrogenase formation chaperone [Acidimicrobiales bacterium]|nr:HypC/HybG/HupF family hydrogenase formation chaperone [Acidimicrobiales bacterium]